MPVSTVSIAAGQWLESADGSRWWFDSGSFALDFVYTGAFAALPDHPERLRRPEDLSGWLDERFPVAIGPARSRDLFDALALREAIGRLAVASVRREPHRTTDVDLVNLYAATPDIPPALLGGSRQAGRSVHPVGQALSTIARETVDLFGPANAGRFRVCASRDCDVVFLDTSRAGTRRWCSMQRCGNRAKVRAHRARRRERTAA